MTQDEAAIEGVVRQRIRSLRLAKGWSLDELARRSHIGPSTISRIETGHRRIALDQLADLAAALGTTIDELVRDRADDDVVIRPEHDVVDGVVRWPLSRPDDPSGRIVVKMRIPPSNEREVPRVHPGRDWFFVLEGTAALYLGGRVHLVETGHAAEFDTMTPHWINGHESPVEIITIFDRHGELAHLHPRSGQHPDH